MLRLIKYVFRMVKHLFLLIFYRKKTSLLFLTDLAKKLNSHYLFEFFISYYARNINIGFLSGKKIFFGTGHGEGAIRNYRVIENEEKIFEKIVFKDSVDYQKLIMYREFLQDLLRINNILAPRIVNFKGYKFIALFYFEYIDGLGEDKIDNDSEYLNCLKKVLQKLVLVNDYLSSMKMQIIYKKEFDLLEGQVLREGVFRIQNISFFLDKKCKSSRIDMLIKRINDMSLVFSHGDLSINNFNSNGYVWDWDRAGYYPAGYDMVWSVVTYFSSRISIFEMYQISMKTAQSIYNDNDKDIDSTNSKDIAMLLLVCYARKNHNILNEKELINFFNSYVGDL